MECFTNPDPELGDVDFGLSWVLRLLYVGEVVNHTLGVTILVPSRKVLRKENYGIPLRVVPRREVRVHGLSQTPLCLFQDELFVVTSVTTTDTVLWIFLKYGTTSIDFSRPSVVGVLNGETVLLIKLNFR